MAPLRGGIDLIDMIEGEKIKMNNRSNITNDCFFAKLSQCRVPSGRTSFFTLGAKAERRHDEGTTKARFI